jgi:hypothetical protein
LGLKIVQFCELHGKNQKSVQKVTERNVEDEEMKSLPQTNNGCKVGSFKSSQTIRFNS